MHIALLLAGRLLARPRGGGGRVGFPPSPYLVRRLENFSLNFHTGVEQSFDMTCPIFIFLADRHSPSVLPAVLSRPRLDGRHMSSYSTTSSP
ncbi:hypothetical protein LY78DRAFT_352651 [Colletotrichum sublineola]|nr:hypothetical protein LY78DRAFT_352651 [Colletotrichum sublineola]